jgi:hypothetical protein
MREMNKLFRWGNPVTERAVKKLVEGGQIAGSVKREDKPGEWLVLRDLIR